MPFDSISQMVDTMRKSVSEIAAAGVDDSDELLKSSFGEFEAALATEIQATLDAASLAKRAEPEELLFKGLGVVGRVANLVSQIASAVENIKSGCDYAGQTAKDDADTPSEEVETFLDHCLSMAELAMRSAVNEHVDVADPDDTDDTDDSANYMVMKSADGADIRCKTFLPEELAKYATDPDLVDVAAADLASAILIGFGAAPESLAKLFEGEGADVLHKGAPGAADPNADPNADPSADPNADPNADQGGDDQDPMGQLNLLGRLLAAAMIQLQSFMDNVGGGQDADPNADPAADPNADPNADPAADPKAAPAPAADAGANPADGSDPAKKKNPFAKAAPAGELAKAALDPRVDDLSKQFTSMTEALNMLLKHPEGAKAILDLSGGQSLAKGFDGTEKTAEQFAAEIDALTGDDRAIVLTKIARGVTPENALRKIG